MAMFGNRRRMFGMGQGNVLERQPYDTPGYGDGSMVNQPVHEAPELEPMGGMTDYAPNVPKVRIPGQRTRQIFDTIGQLGDILTGEPITAQMIERREAPQREASARQQQQSDQWNNWLRQQEYKRANPEPVNNDTVADYEFISKTLGPDAARRMLENKTLPPPFVQRNDDGTSTVYPMGLPRSGITEQPAARPAIGQPHPMFKGVGVGGPAAAGNFMTPEQAQTMIRAMGKAGFDAWQRKHRVQIGGM
jgi:hypothetical protein